MHVILASAASSVSPSGMLCARDAECPQLQSLTHVVHGSKERIVRPDIEGRDSEAFAIPFADAGSEEGTRKAGLRKVL